ncbi:MAG: FG-GAP-like repeat-containing protein [Pseudomonadota bacterium]
MVARVLAVLVLWFASALSAHAASIVADNTVGTMSGEHSVNSGAAGYSIPIVVPPGRAGMQPSLSLNYSSGGGNGLLGVGWSLGGIYAITRCSANAAQDGFADGVEFDGEDRFCLNGQRLLPYSGVYGGSGSQYRTELDSHAKIISYGQAGSGPAYFEVHAKDGMRHYYGTSSNSRTEAQGLPDVFQWRLAYSMDRLGNKITYEYTENNATGESYPHRILYTEHASGNPTPRRVEFGYESRTDEIVGYTHESIRSTTKRLSTITSFVGPTSSSPARKYRINYEYSPTGRSRIKRIQECGYRENGTRDCLKPTEFSWQGEAMAGNGDTNLVMQSTLPGGNGGPAMHDMKRFAQADLNGDGRNDMFRIGAPGLSQPGKEVEIYWGNGTGFTYQSFSITGNDIRVANNSPTIDFNHDGRTDLTAARVNGQGQMTVHAIAYEASGSTWVQRVFDTGVPVDGNNPLFGSERPSGGQFSTMTYVVADVTGDGLHDIVTRDQVGSSSFQFHVYRRTTSGFQKVGTPIAAANSSAMFPMDLDGDGKTDLVVEEMGPLTSNGRSKTIRTLYSNGLGFYERPSGLPVLSAWRTYYEAYGYTTNTPDASPKFLDVNGDGLLDVLVPVSQLNGFRSSGSLSLYENRGGSFHFLQTVPRPLSPIHFEDLAPHIVTYDYNGDGNTDILFPAQKTVSAPGTCIPIPGGPGGGGGIILSTSPGGDLPSAGVVNQGATEPSLQPALPSGGFGQLNSGSVDCFAGAKNDHDGYDWHVYLSNGETIDTTAVEPSPSINTTLSGMVITDLDGDSLADIYGDKPPTTSEINPFTGVFPTPRPVRFYVDQGPLKDVVEEIVNGLGFKVTFTYDNLNRDSVYTQVRKPDEIPVRYTAGDNLNPTFPVIPFTSAMRVVSEVSVSDGLGGSGSNRTTFKYKNARYDVQGRGFLGFQEIHSHNYGRNTVGSAERRISHTRRIYHQDWPRLGLVRDERTWLGNETGEARYRTAVLTTHNVYAPGSATVWNQTVCEDSVPVTCRTVSHQHRKKRFSYPRLVRTYLREPNPNALGTTYDHIDYTSTQTSVDANGNVTQTLQIRMDTGHEAHSKLTTTTTYTYNPPNYTSWWINARNSTTTQTTLVRYQTPTPADGLTETRNVQYTYHANRLLERETIEPGNSDLEVSTTYAYDSWGNRTSTTVSSPVSVAHKGIATRTSTVTMSADKYFPAHVRDAKNHETDIVTSQLTGQPLSVSDPNGVSVVTKYDGFGRPIDVDAAGQSPIVTTYAWADATCNSASSYMVTTTQTGRPSSRVCFDQLNRQVKTRTQGFSAGQWIYTEQQYSPRGLLVSESEPFSGLSPSYFTLHQNHDDAGRPGRKVSPNGMITDYTYQGRRTKVDVNGGGRLLTMYRTYNSLGQLVRTTDAIGGVSKFRYDSFGNPILIEGPDGHQITAEYNRVGHKTRMNDPDRGEWDFVYDVLGQLKVQTDANDDQIRYAYDVLGRMTNSWEKRDGASEDAAGAWVYDGPAGASIAPWKGKLYSVTGVGGDYVGFDEQYDFDTHGRPTTTTTRLQVGTQSTPFAMTVGYDSLGRPESLTYPTGFAVKSVYNSQGYVSEDRNVANNQLLRRVNKMDERNQVLEQELGWVSKLRNTRSYETDTGQINSTCVARYYNNCSTQMIQSILYTYDAFQNMSSRENIASGIKEVFEEYDDLHRIVRSRLEHTAGGSGLLPPDKLYSYDARGNLLSKSDFGTYYYPNHIISAHTHSNPDPNAGPNAVTRIVKTGGGTATYQYDKNGNQISGDGRTIDYTIANKPERIQKGTTVDRFWYSPDQARWKRTLTAGGDSIQTYYVGKSYEYSIEDSSSGQVIRRKHYVGDFMVMTRKTGAETGDDYRFLHTDHLGSVDLISDVNGFVTERKGYDVFGDARVGDWKQSFMGAFAVTTRGFTGHDHLQEVGLIHMNGRVYDAKVGKFLSVDPFIQFPEFSQSLNGYIYVLNNPLSATDPTGYLIFGGNPGGLRGDNGCLNDICTPSQEWDQSRKKQYYIYLSGGGSNSGNSQTEDTSGSDNDVSDGLRFGDAPGSRGTLLAGSEEDARLLAQDLATFQANPGDYTFGARPLGVESEYASGIDLGDPREYALNMQNQLLNDLHGIRDPVADLANEFTVAAISTLFPVPVPVGGLATTGGLAARGAVNATGYTLSQAGAASARAYKWSLETKRRRAIISSTMRVLNNVDDVTEGIRLIQTETILVRELGGLMTKKGALTPINQANAFRPAIVHPPRISAPPR